VLLLNRLFKLEEVDDGGEVLLNACAVRLCEIFEAKPVLDPRHLEQLVPARDGRALCQYGMEDVPGGTLLHSHRSNEENDVGGFIIELRVLEHMNGAVIRRIQILLGH
jgi:hypothetical protein